MALVNAKGPYKSLDQFRKQDKSEYVVSIRGLSDVYTLSAAVTFKKLDAKWKPLNHEGAGNAVLSVVRGDADVFFASYESMRQYIDSGDLRPLLYYDTKRSPAMPDVSIPTEVGMAELAESMNAQRLIGAPPGLPGNIRVVLEEAIRKAIADPEFVGVLKNIKKTANYLDGNGADRVVRDSLASYQTYAAVVKEIVGAGNKISLLAMAGFRVSELGMC